MFFHEETANPLNGEELLNGKTCYKKDLKSATDDTELTFEFLTDKNTKYTLKKTEENPLIFQTQIIYTKPDGSRCLRVITKAFDPTDIRKESVAVANVAVVAQHAVRKAGRLAQVRKFKEGRDHLLSVQTMLQKYATSDVQAEELANFVHFSSPLEKELLRCSQQGSRAKLDDASAKVFFKMREFSINEFLAGSRKLAIVNRRNVFVPELRGCA